MNCSVDDPSRGPVAGETEMVSIAMAALATTEPLAPLAAVMV